MKKNSLKSNEMPRYISFLNVEAQKDHSYPIFASFPFLSAHAAVICPFLQFIFYFYVFLFLFLPYNRIFTWERSSSR